jgi:mannose-6-phosphate isomerase-like protein (cupin superfamily)
LNQGNGTCGTTGMQYKRGNTSVWTEAQQIGAQQIGKIKFWEPFHDISQLPVKMQIWELEPGATEGNHVHDRFDTGKNGNLEEIYYFLNGNGTMWSDGTDVPVSSGDAVLAPPGSEHGVRNTGKDLLKLIIIWGKHI